MGKKEPQMRLVCAETVIRELSRWGKSCLMEKSMTGDFAAGIIADCIKVVEQAPTAHEHRHVIYEEKE